jgi:hypothetical protein
MLKQDIPDVFDLSRRLLSTVYFRGLNKWFGNNRFTYVATANALCANFHAATAAIFLGDTDTLQIWFKFSSSDSSDFSTNTTKVFGFTTGLDRISNLCLFIANFTNSSHLRVPLEKRSPLINRGLGDL